ncbi:hypothetical protein DFH09DRAFT_1356731 [Mycena vulgaris]|nr:hypothetical protein DFH09DRAFT_1356731 [Mycena vulgaris]
MGASAEYTPLDVDDTNDSQDDFHIADIENKRRRLSVLLGNGALLLVSVVLFAVSRDIALPPSDIECSKIYSTFSPAQQAVKYKTVKFNGTFEFPSIYRGTPTPEIDAAWDRISVDVKPTRLDKSILQKIGKEETPSLVKFREEDGGGFMASYETFHQLHCLNFLRKYTYHEHYEKFDHSFQEKPATFRAHLDHCIEMIRSNLMCASDVGLITYEWVQNWTMPYPDFNTVHQCRDFDAIMEWQKANAVNILWDNVYRLPGEVDLATPP